MANKKYNVLAPVIQSGVFVASGEIELDEKYGSRLVESGVLEAVVATKKSEPTGE